MPIKKSEIFIFFDDGDTLNDNRIRGRQWQKLVGKYFSSKFGSEPELWGAANVEVTKDFGGEGVPKLLYENKEKSHGLFIDWFIEKWISEMFDYVGIKRPEKKKYKEIYYNAAEFVDIKVKAAFPGIIENIKNLYHKGYTLCTASGSESIELGFYLEGMGVKKLFKKLYGPDLINILKVDDYFYRAIFEDLGIPPQNAIIIEDKPYYLKIAENLGANPIQACLTGKNHPQFPYVVTDMRKLSKIIEEVVDDIIKN